MIDYTNELNTINKDEEFDYFQQSLVQNQLGKGNNNNIFKAWSLEEHKQFHEAITKFDITDTQSITKYINTRTNEQVATHLKIYRNYCNKQYPSVSLTVNSQSIHNQLSSQPLSPTTSSPTHHHISPSSSSGGISIPVSPLTTTSNTFLSNITNNLFKNLIDQLGKEPSINENMTGRTTTNSNSNNTPTMSSSPPTTSAKGKISLHLASHAIPISMAQQVAANNSNSGSNTSGSNSPTQQQQQPAVNNINNNLVVDSKLKKNQKMLSEPWAEADQKRLEEALHKYPSSRYSSVSRWQVISKELGISPKTVALRYNQMLISLLPKKPEIVTELSSPTQPSDDESSSASGKRKASAKKAAATRNAKKGKKTTDDEPSSPLSNGLPPLPYMNQPISTIAVAEKKEPTIHHLNFDPNKTDSIIQKNNQLIEQIRNDIIYTGSTKLDLLIQYKNNINEALKCTMIWSDDSPEMPPLPVKVNDMIISLMTTKLQQQQQSNNQNQNNLNNNQNSNSSKQWNPLPKQATEWFLPLDDNSTSTSTTSTTSS